MTTPATIYEVAARAGVSISTVSLAINHPARVSAKTRTLVLEAADELGFVPKERAIARAKAGVGRIALVAPFSSYPSFAERMVGAMEALGPDGTQLVVFDHEDIATSDSPLLETLPVRGHVDGIVIMGIPLEDSAAERLAARLPTVLIDQKHPLLSSVWVDDFGGGQMVGPPCSPTGTAASSSCARPRPRSSTTRRRSSARTDCAPCWARTACARSRSAARPAPDAR